MNHPNDLMRNTLQMRCARRLSVSILLLAMVGDAHAVDKRCNNFFGGAFNLGSNWSGGVPGAGDIAEFGLSTFLVQRTYTVDFDVSPFNQALHIEDDFVTFDLNTRTYSLTMSSGTEIGNVAGAPGRLTVTDGTMDVAGNLLIGVGGGAGTLNISSSGRVQSDFFGVIAHSGSGTVNVDGADSAWIHSGELDIGRTGTTGTLNVTAGGLVQSNTGVVGDDGTGTANVFGSQWDNPGQLTIGNNGNGTLNITAGGSVQSGNAVIGLESGSVGEVTVDGFGSSWSSIGAIFVSSFAPGTGTLTVSNGGMVQVEDFLAVRVLGTLCGDGQIIGDVSNVGFVAPGNSAGTLHITGDFTQAAAGTMQIEIGGTTPGSQFDTLDITGAATLDGTLEVSLINGFLPTAGDVFEILSAGELSGTFETELLPTLTGLLSWDVDYDTDDDMLQLAVVTPFTADFDGDGDVDNTDLGIWELAYGATNLADADDDGDSDGVDFLALQQQYTGSLALSAAVNTVPEPATLVMFMGSLLLTPRSCVGKRKRT